MKQRAATAIFPALLLGWAARAEARPPEPPLWQRCPEVVRSSAGASRLHAVLWVDRLPGPRGRVRGYFELDPPRTGKHILRVWLEAGGARWSSPVRHGQLVSAPPWTAGRPLPVRVIAQLPGGFVRCNSFLEPDL